MIDEATARRLLPHIWHPFFGRFGRLTDTQRAAIEPILDGRSVVLCAPTASGKTEAVLGPMIERLIQADRHAAGLRVLVVCPTRALCNDLHRRIRQPVEGAGWAVAIKSGDSPSFSENNPPQLLVTTPESLDSMLSRRPASVKGVESMMLDELHLLDGSPRGDHLRALVWRLRAFCPMRQVCAASATAAQAQRLGSEFAGSNAEVVTLGGHRDRVIKPRLVQAQTLEEAAQVVADELEGVPGEKLLVFANRRTEVESLAAMLGNKRVFAHHGSLSKSERLRTERQFLQAPSGVCVATMTLELGIDIGDVERVVLINPPPNVASFTQRAGRSNRRGGAIQTTCLYSTPFDRQRFEHMIACARDGRLFPEKIPFRPTILAQQAVSLLFQNPDGWVTAKALYDRLPAGVRRQWTVGDCRTLLEIMRRDGYLHADSKGHFVADEPARRQFEYGTLHAHIDADAEVEVIDEATGRRLGTARWSAEDQTRAQSDGEGLLLAGKARRVTRVRDRQVYVEAGTEDRDPEFLSRMGPRYSLELAQDLAAFLDCDTEAMRFELRGPASWRAHHFLGSLWGQCWAAVMREKGYRITNIGPFFADCRHPTGDLLDRFGSTESIEEDLRQWLGTGYQTVSRTLQPGPWKRFIPEEMMRRWVVECVRPGDFSDFLARLAVVESR